MEWHDEFYMWKMSINITSRTKKRIMKLATYTVPEPVQYYSIDIVQKRANSSYAHIFNFLNFNRPKIRGFKWLITTYQLFDFKRIEVIGEQVTFIHDIIIMNELMLYLQASSLICTYVKWRMHELNVTVIILYAFIYTIFADPKVILPAQNDLGIWITSRAWIFKQCKNSDRRHLILSEFLKQNVHNVPKMYR